MGVKIDWYDEKLVVCKGELNVVDIDVNVIFDVVMILVIVVFFVKGKMVICNIYNWCVKEIDCLYVMVIELRKVGVEVVEGEDFIEIILFDIFNDVVINIYNDYCIVMCFVMVVVGGKLIIINDFKCMYKMFFIFFKVLEFVLS